MLVVTLVAPPIVTLANVRVTPEMGVTTTLFPAAVLPGSVTVAVIMSL